MPTTISIVQVENAINSYKSAHPFFDCVLPLNLRLMAEVYGNLIFNHGDSVALEDLPSNVRAILKQWCDVPPEQTVAAEGVCLLRSTDSGYDECEACQ